MRKPLEARLKEPEKLIKIRRSDCVRLCTQPNLISNPILEVQLLSSVRLFVTPWITAPQASLSITNSRSLLKFMSIESVMPSNHLILCVPFFSCFQSFPALGSFPMSQFFAWGGQSFGASASTSILPMNIQDWFPLGWTGWIFSLSKALSRVFCNTTVQKHQFFGAQFSFLNSLIAQSVKNLPAMQEALVQFLSGKDLLKKEMATHSSILARRISWTEEPDGLQSMGSQESDMGQQLNHHQFSLWSNSHIHTQLLEKP